MNGLFRKKHIVLAALAGASLALYLIDYSVLGNSRDIASSFLGNLAFLPLYVIFITLIVEQIVRERERQAVMRKLNMVIGVFFSEVGNRLLRELSTCVATCGELKGHLVIGGNWKDDEFAKALDYLGRTDIRISCDAGGKNRLKAFLIEKRTFLVGLLENQNLLEHEQFTDLLWAVFHLVEELEARSSFEAMSPSDTEHINGDIKRVFGHLSREWVLYMQHLRVDYPYLFSLAVRLNPMLDTPDPRVY
ncbi:hypothetical protein F6V30_12550 [Oryzomonas sagensis]|uniref:Uncharacterized protein n=1 Tax=Oryzomonas sagensis TaxID=2603857 RepID=A0ABQ6TMD4_9BACT|nr:hypothetical protein [Oryzomonas sagensis]KAB0669625.1 hypothetical protein F6V30_12550 [Oryzomonas sagensis]